MVTFRARPGFPLRHDDDIEVEFTAQAIFRVLAVLAHHDDRAWMPRAWREIG